MFFKLPAEITSDILDKLSDEELIESFIKPVYKPGRDIALKIMFDRNSHTAQRFQKKWLEYHLQNDTLAYQPLETTQYEKTSDGREIDEKFQFLVKIARHILQKNSGETDFALLQVLLINKQFRSIICSHLYHKLDEEQRANFRNALLQALKKGGDDTIYLVSVLLGSITNDITEKYAKKIFTKVNKLSFSVSRITSIIRIVTSIWHKLDDTTTKQFLKKLIKKMSHQQARWKKGIVTFKQTKFIAILWDVLSKKQKNYLLDLLHEQLTKNSLLSFNFACYAFAHLPLEKLSQKRLELLYNTVAPILDKIPQALKKNFGPLAKLITTMYNALNDCKKDYVAPRVVGLLFSSEDYTGLEEVTETIATVWSNLNQINKTKVINFFNAPYFKEHLNESNKQTDAITYFYYYTFAPFSTLLTSLSEEETQRFDFLKDRIKLLNIFSNLYFLAQCCKKKVFLSFVRQLPENIFNDLFFLGSKPRIKHETLASGFTDTFSLLNISVDTPNAIALKYHTGIDLYTLTLFFLLRETVTTQEHSKDICNIKHPGAAFTILYLYGEFISYLSETDKKAIFSNLGTLETVNSERILVEHYGNLTKTQKESCHSRILRYLRYNPQELKDKLSMLPFLSEPENYQVLSSLKSENEIMQYMNQCLKDSVTTKHQYATYLKKLHAEYNVTLESDDAEFLKSNETHHIRNHSL